MVSYNVIIGDTITKIAVRISGRKFHLILLYNYTEFISSTETDSKQSTMQTKTKKKRTKITMSKVQLLHINHTTRA